MTDHHSKAVALTAKLSLEEKVSLLTGRDFWNTVPQPTVGLRNMLLSDGPAGVRGEFWDERDNSLNLPSGSALGSTWSRAIAKEYGEVLAVEADRKGVDMVLGPTINLHRTPLGGRHFECMSEDPVLTGALAAAYVTGLQGLKKAACPKHYLANDFETDRLTVNVVADERTLRELYMRPFEDAVRAGAWGIMSSYNSLNGSTLTESEYLETPLRTDWGFDGIVVSDWSAVRSLNSAKFEQDLVMPGPVGPWGDALVAAVNSGEIAESVVDSKVVRILELALRVGAIGADGKVPADPKRHNSVDAKGVSFARKVAVEGIVLLKNDGMLPLNLVSREKVALIGHNAVAARTQGGGSATVHPVSVSTPHTALSKLLGDKLSYSIGAIVQPGIGQLERHLLTNPVTGDPGVRVEFFDAAGEIIFTDDRLATDIVWIGSDVPLPVTHRIVFRTIYTPDFDAIRHLGFTGIQHTSMRVNGEELINVQLEAVSEDPFEVLFQPPHATTPVAMAAGEPLELVYEVDMTGRTGLFLGAYMFRFGIEEKGENSDELIAEAVAAAKAAELAIVVVGTNSVVESEGYDRKNLRLPGRQDELVEAVLDANPNTIIVINSGSPVELPWADKPRAILLPYFGGQEMGNALVDILTGAEDPGGRLPTTWGRSLADVPVTNCTPVNGEVEYTEGLHIGYRAWVKSGRKPLYSFGYGLSYTSFSNDSIDVPTDIRAGDDLTVKVTVTNTGQRAGKHVVQVYASRENTSVERPAIWLAGFTDVRLEAGETRVVAVEVAGREFAHWEGEWKYESGQFTLRVGSASDNLTLSAPISIS